MNSVLVRVGIDQSSKGGGWNAPVHLLSKEFVYVPIPDGERKTYEPGLRRGYEEVLPALEAFASKRNTPSACGLGFPQKLLNRAMHLDPDFEHLTYGDNGAKQGSRLELLGPGDLVVFFSSLRPIDASRHTLVYALIGLYVVEEKPIQAHTVPKDRHHENAHTRWFPISENDIIVRAARGISGRFERCIPIGELRNRAYRLTGELDKAWGGLNVEDGFLQRRVAMLEVDILVGPALQPPS
jgi:hypothetical protein